MLADIKSNLQSKCIYVDKLSLMFSKFLITNEIIKNLLNTGEINNSLKGSYSIINVYNPSLPVKFDSIKNQYYCDDGYENHPVCGITWYGALAIANALGGRLPTENEWEYIASCENKNFEYPWGNAKPSKTLCNFDENVGSTTPVGNYPPNDLGVFDMAGNAEEWCMDSFHYGNYDLFPMAQEKIVKGGAWNKDESLLLIKSRRSKWARIGSVGISFRIVWECGQ